MLRYLDIRTNPEYKFDSVLEDINYNFGYLTGITSGISVNFLNLSGGTVTGETIFNAGLYVNIITGDTYYSGNTPLETIIQNIATASEQNDITRIQPGLNTYTGGTANTPTINVSAATIDNIIVSGNSLLQNITAVTISANTIYSPIFYVDLSLLNISGNTNFILSGNQSVTIDATNPRQVTTGVVRINHNAGSDNTKSIFINTNTGGYGSTSSVFFNYIASGLTATQNAQSIFIQLDKDQSTGGNFDGIRFSNLTNAGAITYDAIHVDAGINPVSQFVSSTVYANSYLYYSASTLSYSNITSACTGSSQNISLFNLVNDVLYIGHSSSFSNIGLIFNTAASNPGIKPQFEYSLGGGSWQIFTPSDGTNGMRLNGNISFNSDIMPGWNSDTVNSISGKYWIRIMRTANNLNIVPVESMVSIDSGLANYLWDLDGNIIINNMSASTFYSGSTPLETIISNISSEVLTFNYPLQKSGTSVSITQASKTTSGYTSSEDYRRFKNSNNLFIIKVMH